MTGPLRAESQVDHAFNRSFGIAQFKPRVVDTVASGLPPRVPDGDAVLSPRMSSFESRFGLDEGPMDDGVRGRSRDAESDEENAEGVRGSDDSTRLVGGQGWPQAFALKEGGGKAPGSGVTR